MTAVSRYSIRPWAAPLIGAVALIACSNPQPNTTPPNFAGRGSAGDTTANMAGGKESGILFIYPKPRPAPGTRGPGIGVNTFLWRGALLTLATVPLLSADPFGGVIITDWYNPVNAPDERFKENVFIVSGDLRSDGVRINVFRQINQGGRWVDAPVNPAMPIALQTKVLDEARKLQARARG
jgi:Domain of unknown function (DUF3576)